MPKNWNTMTSRVIAAAVFAGALLCTSSARVLGATGNFTKAEIEATAKNPDFFKLVPWEGIGFKPVGYGAESVTAIINTIQRIENETDNLPESNALSQRQKLIKKVEENGIIATPANSYINELVNEAARISILDDGVPVKILYGEHPHVEQES